MRVRLCLVLVAGLLCSAFAQAQQLPSAAEERVSEQARQQAARVRQLALRSCHKEMRGQPLTGRQRQAAMQQCMADKQSAN